MRAMLTSGSVCVAPTTGITPGNRIESWGEQIDRVRSVQRSGVTQIQQPTEGYTPLLSIVVPALTPVKAEN